MRTSTLQGFGLGWRRRRSRRSRAGRGRSRLAGGFSRSGGGGRGCRGTPWSRQGSRALGQQVEHVPAGALDFSSRRGVAGVELAVDAREELDELAGAGASGQDAVLVVAELGEDQVQVALLFVFADLG